MPEKISAWIVVEVLVFWVEHVRAAFDDMNHPVRAAFLDILLAFAAKQIRLGIAACIVVQELDSIVWLCIAHNNTHVFKRRS